MKNKRPRLQCVSPTDRAGTSRVGEGAPEGVSEVGGRGLERGPGLHWGRQQLDACRLCSWLRNVPALPGDCLASLPVPPSPRQAPTSGALSAPPCLLLSQNPNIATASPPPLSLSPLADETQASKGWGYKQTSAGGPLGSRGWAEGARGGWVVEGIQEAI